MPTGLHKIDRMLRGGIAPSSITEVVGAPGVGKTQFSMMMSVIAVEQGRLAGGSDTRPYGVVYIDTEGGFRIERVLQMARTRLATDSTGQITASHIHYFHIHNTNDIRQILFFLTVEGILLNGL